MGKTNKYEAEEEFDLELDGDAMEVVDSYGPGEDDQDLEDYDDDFELDSYEDPYDLLTEEAMPETVRILTVGDEVMSAAYANDGPGIVVSDGNQQFVLFRKGEWAALPPNHSFKKVSEFIEEG